MNAVEFIDQTRAELEKLGSYTMEVAFDTKPARDAGEVRVRANRDPHHGETDFMINGDGKRVRRRPLIQPMTGWYDDNPMPSIPHVDEELEPIWSSAALYFEFPWPAPSEAAQDLDNSWVASRARKKLDDWSRDGCVTLDKPVEGFTQVSISEMTDALNRLESHAVGFHVAHAANLQLEEQRRLSGLDGPKPADIEELLAEANAMTSDAIEELLKS